MSDCESKEGSAACCPVEKSVCADVNTVDCSLDLWRSSFFSAMKGAQTDLLKEKIRKEWGPMLDQQADAVLRAMGTHWRSMVEQCKAKEDLRTTFQKIMTAQGK